MKSQTQSQVLQYQAKIANLLDNVFHTHNPEQAREMFDVAAKYFHIRGKHKIAEEYYAKAQRIK